MKSFMIFGAIVGFFIGGGFSLADDCSWATALWRACAAALIGALVLSLASVASKTLIPGVVIPVGIVTSLVGIPFFLAIVLRTRGRA